MIAGSTEMPLLEVAHTGFGNMRGLGAPREGRAAHGRLAPVRPHPRRVRAGRGCRALILEDLEYAKARGARIYAEVVGYGSAADGWDMIQPIERARLGPGDGRRSSAEASPPTRST